MPRWQKCAVRPGSTIKLFLPVSGRCPRRRRPAFLPVALAPQLLTRMARAGYDPFMPIEVPQWRQQLALLRAAWFGFPS